MSNAFIKRVSDYFPNSQITFYKIHVICQASRAVDLTQLAAQKHHLDLKGIRW